MPDEIQKFEPPNPDDVLAAITSFNDPAIITNIFKELNWSYTFEIQEWLAMARQNVNLAVKAKALIQLRKLLREASEVSGYTANVSKTIPNAQGGSTTFHAKRIAGILNPTKQIESIVKEPKNEKPEKPKSQGTQTGSKSLRDRECDRGQGENNERHSEDNRQPGIQEIGTGGDDRRKSSLPRIHGGVSGGTDTGEQFPVESGRTESERDGDSGGIEPADGGEASGPVPGGQPTDDSSPCISTRPPTCNQDLFPGISTSAEQPD